MCTGMFLVLLDVTIVNVALPSIAHGLHADVPALQWVVDGYAVTIASLLLAGGTLGDRVGHRRVLLAGMCAFGAASVACATAPSSGVLVGGRVLQGIGGALMLPATMAVIARTFPEPGEQARALGTWAMTSSLALPLGPLLGGLITTSGSWRWIFWINVPVLAIAVGVSLRVVPDWRPVAPEEKFDGAGVLGFALGLGSLVFAVIEFGRGSLVAGGFAVGIAAVALTGVLAVERRVAQPVLPLDLLRRRAFLAPNVVAFIMNCVVNGTLFVATLYLQDLRGLSPLAAGLLVLPLAVPLVALAPLSGRLTARRGPRTAVVTGSLLAAIGPLWLLVISPHGSLPWLIVGLGTLGCGAGLITASVVAAVVRATPPDRAGLATGMSNTARQIGTAVGVAVFGAAAGSPGRVASFMAGAHRMFGITVLLWLVAFAVAATGVESG